MNDDIFAAARRLTQEDEADKKLRQARSILVLTPDASACFFASIAMSLNLEPSWEIDTFATDGERLLYNPEYASSLPVPELQGVWAHEVMHIANKHHARINGRDHRDWNIATDLSINDLLRQTNVKLPKGALFPADQSLPKELSAEGYYPLVHKPKSGEEDGDEPGDKPGNDPGKCGGVMPAGDGSPTAQREAEINTKIMVAQAHALAKLRGTLPAAIEGMVGQILTPKADPWEILYRFADQSAKNHRNWRRPSRRYFGEGLFLPGWSGVELGTIGLAIDCSGSCWNPDIFAEFGSHLFAILQRYQCRAHVLYHDVQVGREEIWEPDEPRQIRPIGGGGTSHRPVLERFAQLDPPPKCVVCLTDLYTDFPNEEPEFPVLWAVSQNRNPKAPFGEIVALN